MDTTKNNTRIDNDQVKKEPYLLQKGDIIRLEPDMKVYANIPSMFRGGSPFSSEDCHTDILIGQVYQRESQSAQDLVERIYERIGYIVPASKDQILAFVNSLNLDMRRQSFDSSVYAGEYEVHSVASNGGGYGGGGFAPDTVPYPNGWHVYCHKVDDPSVEVDFYQTGHFTAMIENIEPINK